MDIKIEKKKGLKKRDLFIILGALLLVALIVQLVLWGNTKSLRIEKEKITISEVIEGDFNDYIRLNSRVEPISTIYLDADEGGRVKEKLIEEGAMVKAGDIILRLDNRNLYQEIMASESNLAQKENMLRQTRMNFENQMIESRRRVLKSHYDIVRKRRKYQQDEALFADKLIPAEQYRESKEDYDYAMAEQRVNEQKAKNDSLIMLSEMRQLAADLNKMRQTLQLVYERLDNLNVKAPVDGQLGMLDAQVGQSIARGARIGQINVLTDFKVEASVDEHYVDRVKKDIVGRMERQGKSYELVVRKVYPEVRDGRFKIDMVFVGEKPDNIRTGQTYYVNLELGVAEKSILLPRGVFFQNNGGQWVYVVDPSGKYARKRQVRIGRQNPNYYEVLEGLSPGEKVITSSYDSYGDNDKLIIN